MSGPDGPGDTSYEPGSTPYRYVQADPPYGTRIPVVADYRPSEFLAAEPVSIDDSVEFSARALVNGDEAWRNAVVTGVGYDHTARTVTLDTRPVPFKPPSLVGRLPQKEYDAAIVDAAVRLNAELDGCEIDAPGAIGEAMRMLRNAVVNARRA